VDIRGGSLRRGHETTVGLSTTAIFIQRFRLVCVDVRAGSLEKRRQIQCVNARLEHLFLTFENNYVKVNTDRPIL